MIRLWCSITMARNSFSRKGLKRPRAAVALMLIAVLVLVGCFSSLRSYRMTQFSSVTHVQLEPASEGPVLPGLPVPGTGITPTGVTRDNYLNLAEAVFSNLLSDHFDCELGAWISKPYPQDPDLPSLWADGSNVFLAAAAYIETTGQTTLGGCELLPTMWNIFAVIDTYRPDHHYSTGISCMKLVWGIDLLGGPTETNPFWASLNDAQRLQFREWVITNKDWEPAANNMYLFRAVIRYHLYAWGWDDTLAESITDQEQFLDFVTDAGWLYDGPHGVNDYCIYSVFGALFNERLNVARVLNGDLPVRPEQSEAYTEVMLRYSLFAAGEDREPMPWSRSNGLYGLGIWIGLPEFAVAQGRARGIESGMYKRVARLYCRWLEEFWYDGRYFNPYLDPTGMAAYENSFNGNGQAIASLLEAYMMTAETEDVAEVAIPAERMNYDLLYRFGHLSDPTYGVRVVNDLAGALGGSRIEKPVYSADLTPPVVRITAPVSGTSVLSPVRVVWTGSDVQFYMIYIDEGLQVLTPEVEASLPLSSGLHLIEVGAVDAAWNAAFDHVTVLVTGAISPSPTPTPTLTPTSTSTPTLTPTPTNTYLYLPLVLRVTGEARKTWRRGVVSCLAATMDVLKGEV